MTTTRWKWALVATLLSAACGPGRPAHLDDASAPESRDPLAPCTAVDPCCADDTCADDPRGPASCGCETTWSCNEDLSLCLTPRPTPSGALHWDCSWNEFRYRCVMSEALAGESWPSLLDLPDSASGWSCEWSMELRRIACTLDQVPNPLNRPDGLATWTCAVEGEALLCRAREQGQGCPTECPGWECHTDERGRHICTLAAGEGGLPPGGHNWQCARTYRSDGLYWICYGEAEAPPGDGWSCEIADGEARRWRCEREETADDLPPGGGWWVCVRGAEYGGLVCEEVAEEEQQGLRQTCLPGEKRWCDSLSYGGWGQVECDPATGKWAIRSDANGNASLDCHAREDGRRANTHCACYFSYFAPECCERPDCVVPEGSSGQICPASKGQLCDYCNPQDAECQEPGARCVTTSHHESFCGRDCTDGAPCPPGYICQELNLLAGNAFQCVPTDFSCYL